MRLTQSQEYTAFGKYIRGIEKILAIAGGVMLFLLMMLGSSDVIGRYFFNKPILGTLETSQILMAVMIFMGWAYAQKQKDHVSVDMIITRLSPKVQAVINFTTSILSLILFSVIVWQSALIGISSWNEHRLVQTINVSVAPFQLMVSLGAFVLCLELILQIIELFAEIRRRK